MKNSKQKDFLILLIMASLIFRFNYKFHMLYMYIVKSSAKSGKKPIDFLGSWLHFPIGRRRSFRCSLVISIPPINLVVFEA